MADEEDKQSKTEEPTEKKLSDARDKGNIPHSRELSHLATFVAILLVGGLFIGDSAIILTGFFGQIIDGAGSIDLAQAVDLKVLAKEVGDQVARFLLFPVLFLIVLGIAAAALQNVPRVVFTRIQPKASNISIKKGIKKVFGAQAGVEFLKNLFKFFSVAMVITLLMGAERYQLVNVMQVDPVVFPSELLRLTMRLVAGVCAATVILVVIDLVWVRIHWRNNLRMSRQEQKDEHKQTEGDPLVKSRMQSLKRDRARSRMMASIPKATVVVTNPTHYSIALRYLREEDNAPLVVAKGQDLIALKIREVAKLHKIPIVENKQVARDLYKSVEVNQEIPSVFYRAVAEIIHYVYSQKEESAVN